MKVFPQVFPVGLILPMINALNKSALTVFYVIFNFMIVWILLSWSSEDFFCIKTVITVIVVIPSIVQNS